MSDHIALSASSVGLVRGFHGNFTQAKYLRSQPTDELERRIGYDAGRLAQGWLLLFALERPSPDDFEFGGYTYFSGGRIGNPALGGTRRTVEQELDKDLGGSAALARKRQEHVAGLQLDGWERLAKVLPVIQGGTYPVGSGIYQCNIKRDIRCIVAAFIGPGATYLGDYR